MAGRRSGDLGGWTGCLFVVAVVLTALPVHTGPAVASEIFDETQKAIKPRLLTQKGQVISARIRRLVERRLGPDAGQTSTLSASLDPFGIVASAAAADETGIPSWSASADGTVTYLDSNESGASYHGTQVAVGTGLDYALTDRIMIGVLFDYDNSSIRTKFGGPAFAPGRFRIESVGVSPYLGVALSDVILFDASFAYGWADNDIRDQITKASFNSESWNANANISAYVPMGDWTFAPSVGVSYSMNRDEAYSDNIGFTFPKQTIYTSVFNFGATLSYSLVLDNGVAVEPSIGVQGSWEFDVTGDPSLNVGAVTSELNDEMVDLTVTSGLDFALSDNISMSLTGSVGGITKKSYYELSGGALISAQF